ncbi:hypothetical protein I547_0853 [Mycobacterium kansasii 824]|nr:hypothetical protein I547_0853 [Mycobacterium kansasii 824]
MRHLVVHPGRSHRALSGRPFPADPRGLGRARRAEAPDPARVLPDTGG